MLKGQLYPASCGPPSTTACNRTSIKPGGTSDHHPIRQKRGKSTLIKSTSEARDSAVCKVFAWSAVDSNSIPSTTYVPQAPEALIPDHRARSQSLIQGLKRFLSTEPRIIPKQKARNDC